jgi:hypothetical protein
MSAPVPRDQAFFRFSVRFAASQQLFPQWLTSLPAACCSKSAAIAACRPSWWKIMRQAT